MGRKIGISGIMRALTKLGWSLILTSTTIML